MSPSRAALKMSSACDVWAKTAVTHSVWRDPSMWLFRVLSTARRQLPNRVGRKGGPAHHGFQSFYPCRPDSSEPAPERSSAISKCVSS